MNKKKRIFLSYSYEDKNKVDQLVNNLVENGIDVFWNIPAQANSSIEITPNLKYVIETSEIVLVLLSKSFLESNWANNELNAFLKEAHKRKVTVIPVVIEKTSIPSNLLDYEIINLTNHYEAGIDKIVRKLKIIPEISFDHFSPSEFENLVTDLLKEFDFKNVQLQQIKGDFGVDINAEYEVKTPFGGTKKEHWIVEVKFYKQERFSISAIQQLLEYKRNLLPSDLKLLLVTNSILTSVVQDYINDYQKIEKTEIEVIDGHQLKNLISKRKRLLDKYFKV
jgi:hypothetical protein